MNNPKAVIGTNSWGSAAYEKIIRGSVVDNDTLKKVMKVAVKSNLLFVDSARDYGFGKGQKQKGEKFAIMTYQVEQLGDAANTKLSETEMKRLEEAADELNIKILGPDLFRFAVRK